MSDHEHEPLPPALEPVTRRGLLFRIGIGLNVVAASFVGIPLLGYISSALFGRKAQQAWISLGELEHFPRGKTRLATYRNPFTTPWDGVVADMRRLRDNVLALHDEEHVAPSPQSLEHWGLSAR